MGDMGINSIQLKVQIFESVSGRRTSGHPRCRVDPDSSFPDRAVQTDRLHVCRRRERPLRTGARTNPRTKS